MLSNGTTIRRDYEKDVLVTMCYILKREHIQIKAIQLISIFTFEAATVLSACAGVCMFGNNYLRRRND